MLDNPIVSLASLKSPGLDDIVQEFSRVCGSRYVLTEWEDICEYAHDESPPMDVRFDVLVKPGSAEEVSRVLGICNAYGIPVTPRGGGSGVTGGATPSMGGVVLSLERLNKIIRIDPIDAFVIAESGVVTADLCKAVEDEGFYFPVQPTSAAFSFVGGNVAENAGSVNSCKYGVTGRYVLNLEVVLPTGEIFWTGANVSKNTTGLNLTQLFVGSEGVLGVITKVVYRLVRRPLCEAVLKVGYRDLKSACDAIIRIKRSDVVPAALELICHNALQLLRGYLREPAGCDPGHTQLLIDLQESGRSRLDESLDQLMVVLSDVADENILVGFSSDERRLLKNGRSRVGEALKRTYEEHRDIDICMPVSQLYDYVKHVEGVCARYDIRIACFGHAMDGNLHTMIVKEQPSDKVSSENFKTAIHEIYSYAIAHGGVISGEHGIGLLQKELLPLQFSGIQLDLQQRIKSLFDPNGIVNPGKKI